MVTMNELAKRIDRLTLEHLKVVVQTLAKEPPLGTVDQSFLVYGLATEVLRFFFGNKWTNENVFSVHPEVSRQNRRGRRFLRTDSTSDADQLRHVQRVVDLAEMAFNMQSVEGFKPRIVSLQDSDLESALGELECASLLCSPELKFRFVQPSGIKGSDYEGEVVTPTGRVIFCEIKTKSEQTDVNSQTIWATFEKARKQLPKGAPGMILIKAPEAWARSPDIEGIVETAVRRVYGQSHRVVAVVFTWEEYHTRHEDWLIARRVRDHPNRKSTLYGQDIDQVLDLIGRSRNHQWLRFISLVAQIHQ